VSGTVQSRRPIPLWEPTRAARWLRRLGVVGGAVLVVVFFTWFGALRVPASMDTVPSIAPGSWVIVDRRASAVRVGSHVFVAVPDGGTLLSRVVAIDADGIDVQNPNAASTLPDSRQFGRLAASQVRSTVLVVFAPDGGGRDGR
jgi:type IV secretory pathway protease TraF